MYNTVIFLFVSLLALGASAKETATELTFQQMVDAFVAFRTAALAEPTNTFLQHSSPAGASQLYELGRVLSSQGDAKAAWKYFFATAVGSMTSLTETKGLTMLYCPWADVALLCEWGNVNGQAKITDAELLAGDVLRKAKTPQAIPLWRRETVAPPHLSAVVHTSDTIKSFLEQFGKRNAVKAGNWRAKLDLKTPAQQERNYQIAALMFAQARTSVSLYFNEPKLAFLREAMDGIRRLLIEGKIDQLIAQTPDLSLESQQILREVPLDWRQGALMAMILNVDDAFLFVADENRPEYFATFWFKADYTANQARLYRLDFMGHTLNFEQVDALARQVGMKR